jgi:Na+-driven multidrug efflux pump
MWLMAGSAWLIGLPLGYVLAFPLGYGASGVYLALIAQLGVVAVLIVHRFVGNRWSVSSLVAHLPHSPLPVAETPKVAAAVSS